MQHSSRTNNPVILAAVFAVLVIIWILYLISRSIGPMQETYYAIDIVGKETISNKPRPLAEISIKGVKELFISGWAVDNVAKLPAGGVEINIDGTLYPATYGLDRNDVAKAYDEPAYRFSGFKASIPLKKIGKGKHFISIKTLTNDKKNSFPINETIKINIGWGIKR